MFPTFRRRKQDDEESELEVKIDDEDGLTEQDEYSRVDLETKAMNVSGELSELGTSEAKAAEPPQPEGTPILSTPSLVAETYDIPPLLYHDSASGFKFDVSQPDRAGWLERKSRWRNHWHPCWCSLKGHRFFISVSKTAVPHAMLDLSFADVRHMFTAGARGLPRPQSASTRSLLEVAMLDSGRRDLHVSSSAYDDDGQETVLDSIGEGSDEDDSSSDEYSSRTKSMRRIGSGLLSLASGISGHFRPATPDDDFAREFLIDTRNRLRSHAEQAPVVRGAQPYAVADAAAGLANVAQSDAGSDVLSLADQPAPSMYSGISQHSRLSEAMETASTVSFGGFRMSTQDSLLNVPGRRGSATSTMSVSQRGAIRFRASTDGDAMSWTTVLILAAERAQQPLLLSDGKTVPRGIAEPPRPKVAQSGHLRGRTIFYEGYVKKRSARGTLRRWSLRYCYLTETGFSYSVDKGAASERGSYQLSASHKVYTDTVFMPNDESGRGMSRSTESSVAIITNGKSANFVFKCSSEDELINWTAEVQHVISQMKTAKMLQRWERERSRVKAADMFGSFLGRSPKRPDGTRRHAVQSPAGARSYRSWPTNPKAARSVEGVSPIPPPPPVPLSPPPPPPPPPPPSVAPIVSPTAAVLPPPPLPPPDFPPPPSTMPPPMTIDIPPDSAIPPPPQTPTHEGNMESELVSRISLDDHGYAKDGTFGMGLYGLELRGRIYVIVMHVRESSPASEAGIRPGSVLIEVGNRSVEHAGLAAALSAISVTSRPVALVLIRPVDTQLRRARDHAERALREWINPGSTTPTGAQRAATFTARGRTSSKIKKAFAAELVNSEEARQPRERPKAAVPMPPPPGPPPTPSTAVEANRASRLIKEDETRHLRSRSRLPPGSKRKVTSLAAEEGEEEEKAAGAG